MQCCSVSPSPQPAVPRITSVLPAGRGCWKSMCVLRWSATLPTRSLSGFASRRDSCAPSLLARVFGTRTPHVCVARTHLPICLVTGDHMHHRRHLAPRGHSAGPPNLVASLGPGRCAAGPVPAQKQLQTRVPAAGHRGRLRAFLQRICGRLSPRIGRYPVSRRGQGQRARE